MSEVVWNGAMKTSIPGVDRYPEYRRQIRRSLFEQHAPNHGDFLTSKEAQAMRWLKADTGIGAVEPKRRVGRPVGKRSVRTPTPRAKTVTTVCTGCQTPLKAHQIAKGLIRCGRCRQTRSGSQKGKV